MEYRTDRYGNVHVPIGKASFDTPALVENYHAVLDELLRAKPASAKGRYLKTVTTSSTMGPGVKIDPAATHLEEQAPRRRSTLSAFPQRSSATDLRSLTR